MSKEHGGSRKLTPNSVAYRRTQREVIRLRESGRYSSVDFSFFGGGYLAIEKSTMKHKPEEIECGQILADHGYKVILKDEGGEGITPDGFLFTFSYEQRVPHSTTINNCVKALEHAKKKGAEVAVIYDKYHNYHRNIIEEGLKEYERKNVYRFRQIIVVEQNGKIHRHKHN